ncbi:hypothetical protein CBOM_04023 [Ceraceosorus bombacis]|uniref:Uncharacterized protein n=1 Tax=Ceraceosorus bombacis TaxID=401625 RepID=A0A0P1BNM5_9BASI|nr:hypothetical protein CBOM_04023 [Ceraceosorus bombacis]
MASALSQSAEVAEDMSRLSLSAGSIAQLEAQLQTCLTGLTHARELIGDLSALQSSLATVTAEAARCSVGTDQAAQDTSVRGLESDIVNSGRVAPTGGAVEPKAGEVEQDRTQSPEASSPAPVTTRETRLFLKRWISIRPRAKTSQLTKETAASNLPAVDNEAGVPEEPTAEPAPLPLLASVRDGSIPHQGPAAGADSPKRMQRRWPLRGQRKAQSGSNAQPGPRIEVAETSQPEAEVPIQGAESPAPEQTNIKSKHASRTLIKRVSARRDRSKTSGNKVASRLLPRRISKPDGHERDATASRTSGKRASNILKVRKPQLRGLKRRRFALLPRLRSQGANGHSEEGLQQRVDQPSDGALENTDSSMSPAAGTSTAPPAPAPSSEATTSPVGVGPNPHAPKSASKAGKAGLPWPHMHAAGVAEDAVDDAPPEESALAAAGAQTSSDGATAGPAQETSGSVEADGSPASDHPPEIPRGRATNPGWRARGTYPGGISLPATSSGPSANIASANSIAEQDADEPVVDEPRRSSLSIRQIARRLNEDRSRRAEARLAAAAADHVPAEIMSQLPVVGARYPAHSQEPDAEPPGY